MAVHPPWCTGYMLEHPMYPLCRKVRGGDNQQETIKTSEDVRHKIKEKRITSIFVLITSIFTGSSETTRDARFAERSDEDIVRSLWRHRGAQSALGKKRATTTEM